MGNQTQIANTHTRSVENKEYFLVKKNNTKLSATESDQVLVNCDSTQLYNQCFMDIASRGCLAVCSLRHSQLGLDNTSDRCIEICKGHPTNTSHKTAKVKSMRGMFAVAVADEHVFTYKSYKDKQARISEACKIFIELSQGCGQWITSNNYQQWKQAGIGMAS